MRPMRVFGCLVVLLLASVTNAQYSSDPSVNMVVGDGLSDQTQPQIAPTLDGGCYISWFDGLANGYDVRVQKLDVTGKEVFAHNGVLVANLGLSSTTDYGLDVDAYGNALLTFQDDRSGGLQISAAKVSPAGVLLWGASGVQLTNTTDFVASPEVAGTSDGGVVVAWIQESTTRVQKLGAGGAPLWGTGLTLSPATGSYLLSDMHPSGADVILSIVHQTGGFYSPKHLVAHKLDPDGGFLWGTTPVAVFDGGSLQFGNYPEFVTDGSGGAVFSWYDTSSLALQCYAQRILANGTEAFPHNGTAVSTHAARVRVSPWASFNPATNETFVFWEEESSDQAQSGLYGQKLDAAGTRQWTNDGVAIVSVGAADVMGARCVVEGTGVFAFWLRSLAYGQDVLYGARVTNAGVVDIPPFYVASTVSAKSLPETARSVAGYAVVAWKDGRTDDGDVYAQNVNPDGTLGIAGAGVPGNDIASPGLWLASPRPNPTNGVAAIEYFVPAPGQAQVEIYDVRGRVVRALALAPEAGSGSVTWDGRDATGAPVASGVYFVRLKAGERILERKAVLLR